MNFSPREWQMIVDPPRGWWNAPKLCYPYIIQQRDEHTDLLAVNALVPQMPGREDVCQELILALWQKTISIDDLRRNRHQIGKFITRFKANNYERSGYAISLDANRFDGARWGDFLPDPNTTDGYYLPISIRAERTSASEHGGDESWQPYSNLEGSPRRHNASGVVEHPDNHPLQMRGLRPLHQPLSAGERQNG